jgi:hypothetical protein
MPSSYDLMPLSYKIVHAKAPSKIAAIRDNLAALKGSLKENKGKCEADEAKCYEKPMATLENLESAMQGVMLEGNLPKNAPDLEQKLNVECIKFRNALVEPDTNKLMLEERVKATKDFFLNEVKPLVENRHNEYKGVLNFIVALQEDKDFNCGQYKSEELQHLLESFFKKGYQERVLEYEKQRDIYRKEFNSEDKAPSPLSEVNPHNKANDQTPLLSEDRDASHQTPLLSELNPLYEADKLIGLLGTNEFWEYFADSIPAERPS